MGSALRQSTLTARPPRTAQAIARLCTPLTDVDAILGDLAEEYAERATSGTRTRADLWYWSQVLRSALPLLELRFHFAHPSAVWLVPYAVLLGSFGGIGALFFTAARLGFLHVLLFPCPAH